MSDDKRRREREYSITQRRIWNRPAFRNLSVEAKLMHAAITTSPLQRSLPGVVKAGVAAIEEEHNIEAGVVRRGLDELVRAGLAKHDAEARVVWIVDAMKDDRPDNENVIKAWLRYAAELPEVALRDEIVGAVGQLCQREDLNRAFEAEVRRLDLRVCNGMADGRANPIPIPIPPPDPFPSPSPNPTQEESEVADALKRAPARQQKTVSPNFVGKVLSTGSEKIRLTKKGLEFLVRPFVHNRPDEVIVQMPCAEGSLVVTTTFIALLQRAHGIEQPQKIVEQLSRAKEWLEGDPSRIRGSTETAKFIDEWVHWNMRLKSEGYWQERGGYGEGEAHEEWKQEYRAGKRRQEIDFGPPLPAAGATAA